MSLDPGWRLDRYEIVELIGKGGMGEVYRAYDAHLERAVALKVLSEEFTANERLRARFEREAKTISSLNHPNICVLHDVGEATVDGNGESGDDGSAASKVHYLVMELCEGETLAEALRAGPLRIERVFDYGIEIAEGLAKAHRAGIIHRDLKPANIAVTREGIKILDFGLARQGAFATTSEDSTTDLRDGLTDEGQIVGTVRYMPPEVLGGRKADQRSDIFSLGAVLYEMVTGTPAFSGETRSEVIASIVKEDPPPIGETRPAVPRALQMLIDRCLAKDPLDRWESAHDIAQQLREIREIESHPEPVHSSGPATRFRVVGAVLIVVAILAALAGWFLRPRESPRPTARLSMNIGSPIWTFAMSPDGNRFAYSTRIRNSGNETDDESSARIYLRSLTEYEPTELATGPGTAFFFSPDGQWVGYWRDSELRKISTAGGANETTLASHLTNFGGATWGLDGYIYFAPSITEGIWRVPETGGKPEVVTVPNAEAGENSHRWPHALPDGRSLLFTIRPGSVRSIDDAWIAVFSLETKQWRVIHEGGHSARYTRGFLVFAHGDDLFAAPVGEKTWSLEKPPERVVEGVSRGFTAGASFDLTSTGDLAYLPSEELPERTSIFLQDRDGNRESLATVDLDVQRMTVSPDGTKLALNSSGANNQVWIYDLERKVARQLTFERDNAIGETWSADGRDIFYSSFAEKAIMRIPADGSAAPERMAGFERTTVPSCVTPDGEALIYEGASKDGDWDLWLLPLRGGKTPRPLIQTPATEAIARISPDGKWIAYMAKEGEKRELFVQPFDAPGPRWQVSRGLSEPATSPVARWSSKGNELFYRRGSKLYAARVSENGAGLRFSEPEFIGELEGGLWAWEVVGDRFLSAATGRFEGSKVINVVLNWRAELEKKFNPR